MRSPPSSDTFLCFHVLILVLCCVMSTTCLTNMFLLKKSLESLIPLTCLLLPLFLVCFIVFLILLPIVLPLLLQSFGAQGAEPMFPQTLLEDSTCPGVELMSSGETMVVY